MAMLMLAGSVNAKPVDVGTARRVAETYLHTVGMKNTAALVDITAATPFTEFYVFAAAEGGFILVSADDCVKPVLGYSVSNVFDAKEIPDHVRAWLEGYEGEIRHWKAVEASHGALGSAKPTVLEQQWQLLKAGATPPMPLSAVAPLMATTWNQAPYYNNLCPYDANENEYYGYRVVSGCVATATAQVMKYHNHPATGYGSHSYTHPTYGTQSANFGATTYAWSSMPTALTSTSSTTQINAVATLMYHIGVADEMNYGLAVNGGSSAYNYNYSNNSLATCSQASLMSYFKYRPDMAVVKRNDYPGDVYCAILRGELDQSRPILYFGSDTTGGHSFVIDGYNAAGDFHVNWGWGSSYDGYYTMGDLVPGGGGAGANNGSYNLYNAAIIGIRPNASWSTSGSTAVTASVTGGTATITGAGSYSFGDTVMLSIYDVAEGYRFARWSDYDCSNPRIFFANGGSYDFTAQLEPLQGDTLSYCGPYCEQLSNYSVNWNDYRWGIRLPASVLPAGKLLRAVQVFIPEAGTYELTVYTGTSSPTTAAYTTSVTFGANDAGRWQDYTLSTPMVMDGTQNLWLTFTCYDVAYPAAITRYCGNNDGLLFGNSLSSYSGYTFMIRGIFERGIITSGDTLSYCGDSAIANVLGTADSTNFRWGIRVAPENLAGRNYIRSVQLYVHDAAAYTLNIAQGGSSAPGTTVYTKTVNFSGQHGWRTIDIDVPVSIDHTMPLWITFSAPTLRYPGSVCNSTGYPDGDWYSTNGSTWSRLGDYPDLQYNWLIRFVTSATVPPPYVHVVGPLQRAVATPVSFTATATTGATVSWTLPGATPSTATGTAVTASWNTPGLYPLVATVTNSYGSSADTFHVRIVDYTTGDTLSYCLDRERVGRGLARNDSLPFYWGVMMPPTHLVGRNYLRAVQLFVPMAGTYTLRVHQNNDATGPTGPRYSRNYTFTNADTGHYNTLVLDSFLSLNTTQNLWITFTSPDAYRPAAACTYMDEPNSDWLSMDDVHWGHIADEGFSNSWLIKAVTLASIDYNVIAQPNNPAYGSVNGGATYRYGTTATLTATPAAGYHFVAWTNAAGLVSTANPYSFTVTEDVSLTALFEVNQFTVTLATADPSMGTVSPVGSSLVDSASSFSATATPAPGHRFVAWKNGATEVSTDNPYTFSVTSDITLTATFEAEQQGCDSPETVITGLRPNPVTDKVILDVTTSGEVSVIDNTGRVVLRQQVTPGSNILQVGTLPDGVYYVKMGSHHTSFIINH